MPFPEKADLKGITDILKVKPRVRRGAALLRAYDPQWYRKLDLERLKFHDPGNDIIGQVTGKGPEGIYDVIPGARYDLAVGSTDAAWNGFDLDYFNTPVEERELHDEWARFVVRLKDENPIPN